MIEKYLIYEMIYLNAYCLKWHYIAFQKIGVQTLVWESKL
jgi:hypothetical protein